MCNEACDKFDEKNANNRRRPLKKITPQRLKNIALYYLKRFDSSVENLRQVLLRRVKAYVRENPEFDTHESDKWIENILNDFVRLGYLDDYRFAEIKIRGYLAAGKPERYIVPKLRQKGISSEIISDIMQNQEYDALQMALKLASKKKIGPYRPAESRREFRQKDMGTLIRAGFDYDVVTEVLNYEMPDM